MKKSVVTLIALIYVAAIALVSFYGLKFKAYEEKVYVSGIEITNKGVKYNDQGGKYIVVRPDANGELKLKVEYSITPDNATNKVVEFKRDMEINYVSITEDGTVVFDKAKMGSRGAVEVTIYSTDGTGLSDTITIFAYNI